MSSKNKILFLLHIPPPVHGSSVVGLSIMESNVINTSFQCEYINLLASHDIAESGTVSSRKLRNFFLTWIKIFRVLRKFKPDIAYLALSTTGAAFFKDILIVILLKIFSIKRIYHLHNKGVSIKGNNLIYRILYRYVFKKAEVILLSNKLYHDIETFVSEEKLYICPNGIENLNDHINDPDNDAQHLTDSLLFNETSTNKNKITNLLFLSNLIESKGVFDLLDACAILKARAIPFKCTFIGGESDISSEQFKIRVNELDLDKDVVFEGKKFDKDKEMAYKKADIFVFPTYYSNECFPLVLLEAMSYSLPVVSTFEGGIQDIVESDKTGILVEQQNVRELADQLEYLIKNPEIAKQMGTLGRKRYEEEFTLVRFENNLKDILQQAINNK